MLDRTSFADLAAAALVVPPAGVFEGRELDLLSPARGAFDADDWIVLSPFTASARPLGAEAVLT